MEQYDKTDEVLQKLENSKKDTGACFEIISERFTSCALPLPKDFAAISIKNQKELEVVTAEYSNVQQQLIQHEKKIATAKSSYEKLLKQHEKFQENFKKKSQKKKDSKKTKSSTDKKKKTSAKTTSKKKTTKTKNTKEKTTKTKNTKETTKTTTASKNESTAQTAENQTTEAKQEQSCEFLISCKTVLSNKSALQSNYQVPSGGKIYEKKMEFEEGDTVMDVLKRTGVDIDVSKGYVAGIDGLYEFDCGKNSGWMYRVNGKFPNYMAGKCKLHDGDKVEWLYTCVRGDL